jgi:tetratricopeptide (TPR) repeat protein
MTMTYRDMIAKAALLDRSDRVMDAARLYEQALEQPDMPGSLGLEIRHDLARCYLFMGKFTEAITEFSQIHVATRHDPAHDALSYRALFEELQTIRIMKDVSDGQFDAHDEHEHLIEDGLQWLDSIGKWNWRAPLLIEKAKMYAQQHRYALALDSAEEAFAAAKRNRFTGPSFALGSYASFLIRYASELGRYDRAMEVIAEMEHEYMGIYTRIQFMTEKNRVLRDMERPHLQEAVDGARTIGALLKEVQSPKNIIEAYTEMVKTFMKAGAVHDAEETMDRMVTFALGHTLGYHDFLCRSARRSLKEAGQWLQPRAGDTAQKLHARIQEWMNALDHALPP